MKSRWLSKFIVLLLVAGCKPDVGSDPTSYIPRVVVAFDPTVGLLPLPNDILRENLKVAIPTELPIKGPDGLPLKAFSSTMEEFVTSYLNRLDAWPVAMPLSVSFSSYQDQTDPNKEVIVDHTTLKDAIKVYDVTDIKSFIEISEFSISSPIKVVGPTGVTTWQVNITPARPWTPGHTYAALVLTRARDTKGESVSASLTFNYLKSKEPLVADPLGNDDPSDPATYEDDYSLIPAADVQSESDRLAKQLEMVRLQLKPIFDAFDDPQRGEARFSRNQIAILWTFTVSTDPELVFDPGNGVIPTPNDLLFDTTTKRLSFPLPDGVRCDDESSIEKLEDIAIQGAFFCYLNGLDGFSATSIATASFSTALLDASVTGGGKETTVRVFDITDSKPSEVAGIKVLPDGDRVQVIPKQPFQPGHRYLVVFTNGITNPKGGKAHPSPVMAMLLLESQLAISGKSAMPGTLSDEDAVRLEAIRAAYEGLLNAIEEQVPRSKIAGIFSFTISSDNEALFDPAAGVIPFPNEVLIDQTTGRVNLPISPSDPEGVQAIIAGLNTLDGFSTTGPVATSFALPLDGASLKLTKALELPKDASLTDFIAELGNKLKSSSIGVADITEVDSSNPLTLTSLTVYTDLDIEATSDARLVLRPKPGRPLPPNRRFMVVIFDSVKSASPVSIHVSPTFYLARTPYPLVNAEGKSNIPQVLSDSDAAQLEALRQAYKPIFDAMELLGIKRERVLLFFTFRTLSTYQELNEIVNNTDLPAPTASGSKLLPVSDSAVKSLFGTDPSDKIGLVCIDCVLNAKVLLSPPDMSDKENVKLGHFAFDKKGNPLWHEGKIPFLLLLPDGEPPQEGFPVVLFQHGLENSKTQVTKIANDLAGAGFAVVAPDAPYHGSHPIRLPSAKDGSGFFSADVFAVRDNLREMAIEQRQFTMFLKESANQWLENKMGLMPDTLDTTHIRYLGVSLGGIAGAVSAAVNKELARVALVVAGGHLIKIFTDTENVSFQAPLIQALAALGIAPGSAEFEQFVNMAQWALDQADPVNYAQLAEGSRFLLVEALGDEFIPNSTTEELRIALGPEAHFKAYPEGGGELCHGFFLDGCDGERYPNAATATAKARDDVISFLSGP